MADDTEVDLGIGGFTNAVPIGRGGFAVVYRAYQPRFDRLVAVKVFVGLLIEEGTVATFERECRAIGRLSGRPNILQVYDAGISPANKPYMVMAYMAGGTLDQRLHSRGPLPWEDATSIGVKVARALQAAHDSNVLHRDVKPENVLLSEDDEPYLGDFGISRLTDATRKTRTNVSFTPAHVAPEIVSSGEPTVAVDIYSLASTLYEVMAGRPAFVDATDDNMLIILRRVINDPVPDLMAARGVPEPIRRVIEGAMAKNPADRPHSASAFARQLEAAVAAAKAAGPEPVRLVRAAPDDRSTLPPIAVPPPSSFTRPPAAVEPRVAPSGGRPATPVGEPRSPWAPPAAPEPVPPRPPVGPPFSAPVRPASPAAGAPSTIYSGPIRRDAGSPADALGRVRPASPNAAAPSTIFSGPGRPASPDAGGSPSGFSAPVYPSAPAGDARGAAAFSGVPPGQSGRGAPPGFQPPPPPPDPRTEPYGSPGAGSQPSTGRKSNRTVLVVVVAVIVVVIIVVVVIVLLGHKASPSASSNTVSTTTVLPTVATVPGTVAGSATTTPPAPTSTSLVSLANGATSPYAAGIELSLATYFNAINNHDWQAAWNQFTPAEKAAEPVAMLAQGASSSKDSGVVVTGFVPQSDGSVVARVSFTSMQAPADSPDQRACDRWTLNYDMTPSANGFLIGQSTPAANPPYQSCPPAP